ncbi:MAG: Endonuclease/Exonuclease/phosphatase family protein [bacterium ADurb.Bin363]|nr:MAG: Endonuclease/Exonuclease/phosphatase family protein [bacterium ADurb.Bin363]
MKIDNTFDFTFVVAHLKAMFDDKSIATRTEQAKRINKWISEHLEKSNDKDLIFVGDFNDFVGSDALKSLQKGKNVHFLTEGLAKEFYSNIPYKGLIDHCTVTNVEGGAMDEVIPGSIHTIDEKEYPGYLKSVSDHKPVLFIVKTDKDND